MFNRLSAAQAEGFAVSSPARLRVEILAGLTVALALVPEAVAFAFVAGVHPLVGLYAAFIVGLVTATIGGRPGMISGAARLPRLQFGSFCDAGTCAAFLRFRAKGGNENVEKQQ